MRDFKAVASEIPLLIIHNEEIHLNSKLFGTTFTDIHFCCEHLHCVVLQDDSGEEVKVHSQDVDQEWGKCIENLEGNLHS